MPRLAIAGGSRGVRGTKTANEEDEEEEEEHGGEVR